MRLNLSIRMWVRTSAFCALMLGASACAHVAQDGATDTVPAPAASALPGDVLGVYASDGRFARTMGPLILEPQVVSWGGCQRVHYRVFRQTDRTYYLEQTAQPACAFTARSTYLVLVTTSDGLEVSLCPTPDEFGKGEHRKCSRSVLYKQSP